MTANMFDWHQRRAPRTYRCGWAFNRADLEVGRPLRNVVVDSNSTTYFSLLPSNMRGDRPPPAGRENLLVTRVADAVRVRGLEVPRRLPGSGSTFTGPTNVGQTTLHGREPHRARARPTRLDSLPERLMMQSQYRNIGGTESLWVNHTVHAAARRRSDRDPVGADQRHRRHIVHDAGAAADLRQRRQRRGPPLDGQPRSRPNGDMALGYSASSATVEPGHPLRGPAGHRPVDTLPQGEATLMPVHAAPARHLRGGT